MLFVVLRGRNLSLPLDVVLACGMDKSIPYKLGSNDFCRGDS